MVIRMLHYKIKPGKLDEYLGLFAGVKERVANIKGLTYFELFRDLKDPNTLFIAQVFEDGADMEKYAEIGPNEDYNNAVLPMIEGFGHAMTYEVNSASPLPLPPMPE